MKHQTYQETIELLDVTHIIEQNGLGVGEIKEIISDDNPILRREIWQTASDIRKNLYHNYLQCYAPLYISNYCVATCKYCPFNSRNKEMVRRRLTFKEIKNAAEMMADLGHKNICILAGDDPMIGLEDYAKYINAVASLSSICSVTVNIDIIPHRKFDFNKLINLTGKSLWEFRLFQETYHKPTFEELHKGSLKADYDFRWHSQEYAAKADVQFIGIGILLGLYNWRFEIIELINHGKYLLEKGYPLHTISIPRWQKGLGLTYMPEYAVNDEDFFFFMALLKLAFPKQNIIITSRETKGIMDKAYEICTITDIEPKPYVGAYTDDGEKYKQCDVNNKMTFKEFEEHFKELGYKLIDYYKE